MRPLSRSLSAVLLVGCLVTAVALAGELECDGPYKSLTLRPEELEIVLRNHQAWLEAGAEPNDERRANLCQAALAKADLRGANLQQADLQRADLREANLQHASLWKANLQQADLREADLQHVLLFEANLQHASLSGANLQRAAYEPNPGTLPNFWTFTDPGNHLDTLVFYTSPAGLIALREAFKKGGMRTQERQLTYAIEHTRRLQAWQSESLWDKSESLFKLVAFELPSDYGMSPGRALKILGGLIGLFALCTWLH